MTQVPASSHGGAGATAPLTLTGTADEIQLKVVGFANQNDYLVRLDDSNAVVAVWSADRNGYVAQNGQLAITPPVGSSDEWIDIGAPAAQVNKIMRVFLGANVVFALTPEGSPMTAVHAAPADASLAAGDCALWYDQTNAASKLMVKAKQADGTVKTAAIALA